MCGEWNATFAPAGPDQPVRAWLAHDDGTGTALYAAGSFRAIGAQRIAGVARWDGAGWTALGSGLPDARCLAVFDDGAGPQLYAGGSFRVADGAPANTVARWNGASWSALPGAGPDGVSDSAAALAVFDDGSGPALFVAGHIGLPGVPGDPRVVRWSSAGWSAAGAGLELTNVSSLCVFDAGAGPRLYAGSDLAGPNGGLFVWNGAGWSAAAPVLPGMAVSALAVARGPGGNALYAAGHFGTIGGATYQSIARYDGSSWSAVGGGLSAASGIPGFVQALAVHDDRGGPRLYAGGSFALAGGVPANGLARWDGMTWEAVQPLPGATSSVTSLVSFDDGGGPALFVSGLFGRVGHVAATNAARWRHGAWSRLADGEGASGQVLALVTIDDGHGPAAYAGGSFESAGTTAASRVARWDGARWNELGAALGTDGAVEALAAHDDGAGPRLFAAGAFTRIGGTSANGVARWDGQAWAPLGSGLDGHAEALCSYDDGSGPALYVGGQFGSAGGVAALNVARWDGAGWSALGSGTNLLVRDLAVHDDGTGPALYACGLFTSAGGVPVQRVARWDGATWSAVGTNIASTGQLGHLRVFDAGAGPELYLAGSVSLAGASTITPLVRWDGTAWSSLGLPVDEDVAALTVLHDGTGPCLLAALARYGPTRTRLAEWDGTQWRTIPGEIEGSVRALTTFDGEGDGVPDLIAGGALQSADGEPAANLARWSPCGALGEVLCAGDGSAAPCPCGNLGAPGHGCASSAVPAGGALVSAGLASLALDTLRLEASGLTGTSALFAQGTASAGSGAPFDDGILCLAGTVVRLGTVPAAAGAATYPGPGGAPIGAAGAIPGPGSVRAYQVLYRNVASFCTPGTSNLTNALRVTWSL